MEVANPRGARALFVTVLVVAISAVAAWWIDGAGPAPASFDADSSTTSAAATAPTSSAGAAAPQPSEPPADAPASDPLPARTTTTTPASAPREFLVRGRCVDEHGHPLADCLAALIRGIANTKAGEAWRQQNPGQKPPPPNFARTTADGLFAIAMESDPSFLVYVRLERPGCVPAHAMLDMPTPGAELELGDVVLWPGVRVVGTVTFDDGRPCPNSKVILQDHDATHAPQEGHVVPVPHVYIEARTRDDGTFEFHDPVRPCTWNVDAREAGHHPFPLEVKTDLARPIETVAVVVEAPILERAITGRVTDPQGEPVAGANVNAALQGPGVPPRPVRTAADGTFSIAPLRSTGVLPVRLMASKGSRMTSQVAEPVAWGTTGVELVLQGRPTVTLRVTDESGTPIEDYVVLTGPGRLANYVRGRPLETPFDTQKGPHLDGRCEVQPLHQGEETVRIDFPKEAARASCLVTFQSADSLGKQIDVLAPRGADVTVHVVDASGAAVAGTTLAFYDLLGEALLPEMDEGLERMLPSILHRSPTPRAVLLCHEGTDADGKVRVQLPTGVDIGFMAEGPGHIPLTQALGPIAPGTTRTIVVRRGARLSGRVGPESLLVAARQRAGLTPFAEWPPAKRPRILLMPPGTEIAALAPMRKEKNGIELAADGTFDADGLVAGTFDAVLRSAPHTDPVGTQPIAYMLGTVHLADGAAAELVVDVDVQVASRGSFRLLCNGAPLAHCMLLVQTSPPTRCRTDAEGRFSVEAAKGSYAVLVENSPSTFDVQLLSETLAVLPQTGSETVDIHCRAAMVKFRALDATGSPLGGKPVRAKVPGTPELWLQLGYTDPNGRIERWMRVGPHELEIRIGREPTEEELAEERRRLAELTAGQKPQPTAQQSPDAMERAVRQFAEYRVMETSPWHPLGSFVVESELPAELELRMPER